MHRLIVCLLIALPLHALTYTVVNTNDSGAGSLRQAIVDANTNPGVDFIEFQIPGAGVHTITLASALAPMTDPIIINGSTQPGASLNTSSAGLNSVVLIELDCNGSGFPGLVFTSTATGSVVRGLAIGRCLTGIAAGPNTLIGVSGAYVGTDATGTVARANGVGIELDPTSSGSQIGLPAAVASRNLISGNVVGINAYGSDSTMTGNLIGTTASGTAALPNGNAIVLRGSDNIIDNNVISGNASTGVTVVGPIAGNTITNCAIGTAVDGTSALGNGVGIALTDGPGGAPTNTTIANNIIRFNTNDGVQVVADVASSVRIPSTNSAGRPAALANPLGTTIDDNEIRDNGGLGIDFQDDGVTLNDPGDTDGGANALQNFPVITSAVASGSSIGVAGTLQSLPNASFNVQLFHNDTCDGSGYGEGAFFLGEVTVTTDAGGNGAFNTAFSSASTTGVVTATATEIATGNTSEFSLCEALVAAGAELSVADVSIVEGNAGTSNAIVTVTLSPASPFVVQVDYATSDGTATSSSDYAQASGTLTFPADTTTQTFTIPIVGDLGVEGDETVNVTLSSPSNATIDDGSAIVTITNDDGGAAPAATPIPTLTEIGLMLFAAAMALLAFLRLR